MTRVEVFEQCRPLLSAIAYRMLGSVSEAEDAVQETWLRYDAARDEIVDPRAFLSTVVMRVSITMLTSARSRRETYVGDWLPEPLLDDPYQDPARAAELRDSVSMAALALYERLSPLERAVFVLREAFGERYADIARALDRTEVSVRQVMVRARRHVRFGQIRFDPDDQAREALAARFFRACVDGDVDSLRELLASDVRIISDSGGKAPALGRGVAGVQPVAGLLGALAPRFGPVGLSVDTCQVKPQPGAVVRAQDGGTALVIALDIVDGRVRAVRSVANPDKLAHLGPVDDPWAVAALIAGGSTG